MLIRLRADLDRLLSEGMLILGEGAVVEDGVEICHPTRSGEQLPVRVGAGCLVRSGSVLYSGVSLGAGAQTGHQAVIRENASVGSGSVVGTQAMIELNAVVGAEVMIETKAYITANTVLEDYVFVGPGCVTTNDLRMLWRRDGAGEHLVGPHLEWGCRVGGGAVLLPGVRIGREAVVGAGSVVTRDVAANTVVVGNPARVVGATGGTEPIQRR